MLVEHVIAKRAEKRALTQEQAHIEEPQVYIDQSRPQTQIYGAPEQQHNSNQGYGQRAGYYQNQSRGMNEGVGEKNERGSEKRDQWVDEKLWKGEGVGDVDARLVGEEVAPPRYSVVVT